jgi:SMI1 / KNR4 family (SUKH-1)
MTELNHALFEAIRTRVLNEAPPKDILGWVMHPAAPASPEAIHACEAAVGCALPPLLTALYLEVANGGFGPGYGLIGVEGGHLDGIFTLPELVEDLHSLSEDRGDDPSHHWNPNWLPLCHWGCGIYSAVDARAPFRVFNVWPYDKPSGEPMSACTGARTYLLDDWLARWLAGHDLWREMHEPVPEPAAPQPSESPCS